MPLGSAVSVMLLIFSSLGILLYMRALRRVELART
jgi:spermidine/putrescine transport system permease protein